MWIADREGKGRGTLWVDTTLSLRDGWLDTEFMGWCVCRMEVESIGHNLTSVMMNPRDASMSDLDVSSPFPPRISCICVYIQSCVCICKTAIL